MDFDIGQDILKLLGESETSAAPAPSAPSAASAASAAMEGITDPASAATADTAAPTVVAVPVPVTRQEREAFFYESIAEQLDKALPVARVLPPENTGRTLHSDNYYVTWPLFLLPKFSKDKGFTHPFVSDVLPLQVQRVDLGPKDKIIGYDFRKEKGGSFSYTLTTVDPIFIGIQVREQNGTLEKRIPVLAITPGLIDSLALKSDLNFRERVLTEFDDLYKNAPEKMKISVLGRRQRLEESRNDAEKAYKESLRSGINIARDIQYYPVAMNAVGELIGKEGINTRYFIIETELAAGESSPTIWMTEELFVGRERAVPFLNEQKLVVELAEENKSQPISMYSKQQWYRGPLFKYSAPMMTVQQSGVYVLPHPFVLVHGENKDTIYEFDLYLAYLHTKKETTLVWRNPQGNLVPITILVATNTGTDRIINLNAESWGWAETNLNSRNAAARIITNTLVKQQRQGTLTTPFAEYIRDNWDTVIYSLFRTPRLWDVYSLESLVLDTPLEKYFREIVKSVADSYETLSKSGKHLILSRDKDEDAEEFFRALYSSATFNKALNEITYGVVSTTIRETRRVLSERRGILSIYNSYTIAAISIASLKSDPENKSLKHFYVPTQTGRVEASTRGKTVHLLFEQEKMYLLRMRNKVALVQVRAVNETGIILERGELVQVVKTTKHERGLFLRVATTGGFSLTPENGQRGVILIDPHVQWNGEFVLITKDLLEKTREETEKRNLDAQGAQEVLKQKFKYSKDRFKYAVVHEIYRVEFSQEENAQNLLGPIEGGNLGSYRATLRGLREITFESPPTPSAPQS